ncbi:uncharacterized protein [Clytia hemisphaerica]|uniref:Uncharacterized protein n=1 Tax=Clytia hemisphaerica TaxID=252671 RepID=A0A7M5X2D6_9CNID
MEEIERNLLNLKPKSIDTTKCTPRKSLYEQIMRTSQERLSHQNTQFNMGNGQTFTDPIKAAEYLLEREYGDTFLYGPDSHETIFIPPEFVSNQYSKESPVLQDDIEQTLNDTLQNLKVNSPNHWFTKELDAFCKIPLIQTADGKHNILNRRQFDNWVLNVKIRYLIMQESKLETLNIPSATSDFKTFVQACEDFLAKSNPQSETRSAIKQKKNTRSQIKEIIEKYPPKDPVMRWFFELELSDRGEDAERSFFEKLLSLKNKKCAEDLVILQSMIFLTDVGDKKHQEFDSLIFSWSRKLIIGIEVKTRLTNKRPFEQLQKYHSIFEEKLGDQLGPGWTFYPAIYVESDQFLWQNRHYIHSNDTDVEKWLSSIMERYPISPSIVPLQHPLKQLKKIIQIIVFTIYVSKKDQLRPITSSCWTDYVCDVIDSLSSSQNIVFYSQNQFPVLASNDPSYNKLVILGGFGTGKSFLLQEKAILLSKDEKYKGRILYMVCGHIQYDKCPSLLYFDRKRVLEPYGIVVRRFCDFPLFYQVNDSRDKFNAIFLDESNDIDLACHSWTWQNREVCWVAPEGKNQWAKHERKKEELLGGLDILSMLEEEKETRTAHDKLGDQLNHFQHIQLAVNLRNSKEIAKKAKEIGEELFFIFPAGLKGPPSIFPSSSSPVYIESVEKAIIALRTKSTTKGILIIGQDVPKPKSDYQVKLYYNGKNDFEPNEDPIKWLLDGNILITSASKLHGFDWPCIIIVRQIDGLKEGEAIELHESNLIMRCTTSLYIVEQNEDYLVTLDETMQVLKPSKEDDANEIFIKSHIKEFVSKRHMNLIYSSEKRWFQRLLKSLKKKIEKLPERNKYSQEGTSDLLISFLKLVFKDHFHKQRYIYFKGIDGESFLMISNQISVITYYEFRRNHQNITLIESIFKMLKKPRNRDIIIKHSPREDLFKKYLDLEWLLKVFDKGMNLLKLLEKESTENIKRKNELLGRYLMVKTALPHFKLAYPFDQLDKQLAYRVTIEKINAEINIIEQCVDIDSPPNQELDRENLKKFYNRKLMELLSLVEDLHDKFDRKRTRQENIAIRRVKDRLVLLSESTEINDLDEFFQDDRNTAPFQLIITKLIRTSNKDFQELFEEAFDHPCMANELPKH